MTERPTKRIKERPSADGPEVEVVYVSCARCTMYTAREANRCSHCGGQLDNGEKK